MANKATTTFTIQAEDKTKQGIQSATNSFKEFTGQIDSITGGMASKVANLVTNPWTAAAAAIGLGVKATKELWSAGLEAERGATAMKQAWGSAASTIQDYVSVIDRTTLATKEDLEGMANSLAGYGLSAEEVKGILQTTADIATKTGKSFGTVESAVVSAMNGQTRALDKIFPEWQQYGTEVDSAKEKLILTGEAIHDTTMKIQSGSIAQTLDNMSTSWQNIKENLGQTIVMDIEASGVLKTIADFLEKIEEHTRKSSAKNEADLTLSTLGLSISDAVGLKGTISPDLAWTTTLAGTKYEDTADRLRLVNEYLDNSTRKSNPYYSQMMSYVSNATAGNIVDAEGYWNDFSHLFEGELTLNHSRTKTTDELRSDIWAAWDDYFKDVNWSEVSIDGLIALSTDPMMAQYFESKRSYQTATAAPTTTSDGYMAGINVGVNEDPLTRHYRLQHTGATGSIPAASSVVASSGRSGYTVNGVYYSNYNDAYTAAQKLRVNMDLVPGQLNWGITPEAAVTYRRDHSQLLLPFQDLGMGYEAYRQGQNIQNWKNAFGYDPLKLNGLEAPYSGFSGEGLNYWNTGAGPRTTGGGGINTLEGWFLDADGVWRNIEEYEAEQAKLAKEKEEKDVDRHKDIINGFNTVRSAISSLKSWFDGSYQAGEIGSGVSAIGSVVGMFSSTWGTGIQAAGAGIALLEELFSGSESINTSSTSSDYATNVAQYNGGLNLHINNYFEGANIVGEGGMSELALKIQKQIEHFAYDNR